MSPDNKYTSGGILHSPKDDLLIQELQYNQQKSIMDQSFAQAEIEAKYEIALHAPHRLETKASANAAAYAWSYADEFYEIYKQRSEEI